MDSFVSRVVEAVMTPEPPKMTEGMVSDTVSKEPIKTEPPLIEYESFRGKPYTAEYLNIDLPSNIPAIYEKNYKDVMNVEKYVIDEITRRKWEPTLKSYRDIMGAVKSAVNIEPNTDNQTMLERILIYVDSMNKKHKYESKISEIVKKLNETIKGEQNGRQE